MYISNISLKPSIYGPLNYLMSLWSFGRAVFTVCAAADAAGRENTKPLQKPSET